MRPRNLAEDLENSGEAKKNEELEVGIFFEKSPQLICCRKS